MDSLRLRFEPEDHWHGKLIASVSSGGFSGVGEAWFKTDELEAFTKALAAYPISTDPPPSIAGGYLSDAGDVLKQVHLAISVDPHDLRGTLRVTTRLATDVERSESSELAQSAVTRFTTGYENLGRFASELSDMLGGKLQEAVLMASEN